MMMQIVRCESAVAQGPRSDILQATKRRKAHADLSPHTTSLAPKCPSISDQAVEKHLFSYE